MGIKNFQVDACLDANGFHTIRHSDGTIHGNTEENPVATVYTKEYAHIIAAAPELLEACKKHIKEIESRGYGKTGKPYLRSIRGIIQAIAKAEKS